VAKSIVVPPGGFAGFAQQTQATQQLFARAGRKGGLASARRRRARSSAAPRRPVRSSARRASSRRVRSSSRRGPARLVKGSAAARRHMARLRRMRKR
jgi:hypothetical protein